MKISIMQPYLFPYIGYFQLMNATDIFVIYDDVNYINKGWINRNQILINGKATKFTIPLKGASQNKKIDEISLSDDKKWKIKFLKTVEQSYKKAPEFDDTYGLIKSIIEYEENNLSAFIENSLRQLRDYMSIKTSLVPTSSIYQNSELSGQDRILDICKKEGADVYINAINGKSLYSQSKFDSFNINLNFISSKNIKYSQYSEDFVSNLSIIDVLMFNDRKDVSKLLNEYTLI